MKYINATSLTLPISTEVPQGSILAPVLFNIFVDTLLRTLPLNKTVAYADDIILMSCGDSLASATHNMQLLLKSVYDWLTCHCSCMFISIVKCHAMHIAPLVKNSQANQLHLHLSQELLPSVASLSILGITISHDLSRNAHYDWVRKKVSSMTPSSNLIAPLTFIVVRALCKSLSYHMYVIVFLCGATLLLVSPLIWIVQY